jgi:hypothetical protein
MTPRMAYSYSWLLPSGTIAQVRDIIEASRQIAIDLGSQSVGPVIVLTGDEAQAMQVLFVATIPGATEGRYGLAAAEISSGPVSWTWSGAVIVSSMKMVGEFHQTAASLGIEVIESYAGMVFTSKKNADGVVETEQRLAFDWKDF